MKLILITVTLIVLLFIPKVSLGAKMVILSFDDSTLGQYTMARPILDKYSFKCTFFTVCNFIGKPEHMNWTQIKTLQKEGHDIEFHTMNHDPLSKLSEAELQYEIGQSKQCLANHGINYTVFAYPFAEGSDKPNIVNMVSKYYILARAGDDPIQSLKSVNRYSINAISQSGKKDSDLFTKFVEDVNRANSTALASIKFHRFVNDTDSSSKISTSSQLFDQEMKYLHDNGFKVIRMSDLGFSPTNDMLYVKGDHNNVNSKSLQYGSLDQEYKKWHYFSSAKTNATTYSFFYPTTSCCIN
jgi:peptidoglycan/xylan/chitin deacetylase (PgdA/CDA1 family)